MKKLNLSSLCLIVLLFSLVAAAQDEIKVNPNAPADYDANLQPGAMAIGIYSGSPETVKIVSKSGGVYKAMSQESPNPYVVYYKANSVYPYFDPDKLRGLVDEFRYIIEPYVEAYAAKHSLSAEVLKGNGFQFNIGHSDEKELKKRLEKELPKLAQLESRLNEIEAFPQTFAEFQYNPALVKEIAASRNEYFQAMIGKKTSLRAEESVWLMAHRDGIKKTIKEVENYDSATTISMGTNSQYALYAVSAKARASWLTQTQAVEFKQPVETELAPLAALLAKKLPTYFPQMDKYPSGTPADFALLKRALTNPARYKIFKSGLMQSAWQIDKNSLGIPNARYKNGVIYLRDTEADHPYCHATYVNIIQNYSGGGTYAASRSALVADELVACPAGK